MADEPIVNVDDDCSPIVCPRCTAKWDNLSEHAASIALFGYCIKCTAKSGIKTPPDYFDKIKLYRIERFLERGIENPYFSREIKWHMRYLNMALFVSRWSKDPSTQVGCVIIDEDNNPVSFGYNGFPRGMVDTKERYEDREFKYAHVKHAEENAIFFANRKLKGCTVYLTQPPCGSCLGMFSQNNIKNVVCLDGGEEFKKRWNTDLVLKLAQEMSINILIVKEND